MENANRSWKLDVAVTIALFIITAALCFWAWKGIDEGVVGGRRGKVYSLEEDPIYFFMFEGIRVFFAALFAWKLLMKIEDLINPPKRK